MKTIEKTTNKDWLSSVESLPYVGVSTKKSLAKIGINSIKDLLFYFPKRYLDTSNICLIKDLKVNELATVVGDVIKVNKRIFSKRKSLLEVVISDKTGYISAIFFNQPYMKKNFSEGDRIAFAGRIDFKYGNLQINNPLYDNLGKGKVRNTMGILPIHPATATISAKKIRFLINNALDFIPEKEIIPPKIVSELNFLGYKQALKNIHFPKSMIMMKAARRRLIFQEFFELQIAIMLKKAKISQCASYKLKSNSLIAKATSLLPFTLTNDQKKVLNEIEKDLFSDKPMNRLLQGEVGSGKTIVAFLGSLSAIEEGCQASIMAPTEILARQHYKKIKPLADSLDVKIALLTSSLRTKERERCLAKIKSGQIGLIIGTHSLIQNDVVFNNLAYVVVDEQHRFGVEQRKSLNKKGISPHTLVMTATPIPRSLTLTLYGDLDVSTIKELPSKKNFSEKVTTVVCGPKKRTQAYEKIRREVARGRQAYIICPLINASDKLEAKAVAEEIKHLKNIFNDLRVASVHGKLKAEEKEKVMTLFAKGEIDILVATTLVEVGIDVPNATVILIENADRFGLSQLHQLRGRVGRGEHDAVCILFANLKTKDSIKRMKAIRNLKDGFSLAEADLKIRGEGQLFGDKQSGIADLKIASVIKDFDILLEARKQAKKLLKEDSKLTSYKSLEREVRQKYNKLIKVSGG